MNKTLTQIQEEFDEKLNNKAIEDEVYTDAGFGCMECGGGLRIDFVKDFLTQSNLRVIEKVKEWAEKGDRRVRDWKPSTYGEIEIARLAEESILDDLKHFLSHAE